MMTESILSAFRPVKAAPLRVVAENQEFSYLEDRNLTHALLCLVNPVWHCDHLAGYGK